MTKPVISVQGLSKAYNVYSNPRDIIKEAVFGGVRHDVFWALKDISFDVHEGERLGIVGPNGAGKSTLLRIISGNLNPTSGSVHVDGSVSAMLSLTSFLNPEDTGLENIRFNLLLSGVSRGEIPRLTEEIVDFTELGAFIHAPVRTYSSGMHARLAFSISTAISPDILIVDEVLGAGDAYFVGKATQRMIELCESGRALLFVSHSIGAVQMLCDTALWLDGGAIRELGPVEQVVRRYEDDFRREEDEALRSGNRTRRDRLIDAVRPEEFARPEILRFRITGPDGVGVKDQHYVRNVSVALDDRRIDVPIELRDIDDQDVDAALDVLRSEWGRPHSRRGSECRALAQSSSRFRGGHVLVRRPEGLSAAHVTVTFESDATDEAEELVAQYVDLVQGEWIELERVETADVGEGWRRSTFAADLRWIDDHTAHEEVLERLIERERPDVEIVDAALLVDGRIASSVREHQPFEVAVSLRANRDVPQLDVGVRLIRSDGVYTFWQSSGEAGENLSDVLGEKTVYFSFDPNLLGSGDYDITVYAANGWDPEHNYPYSEVFDRKVNAVKLTVIRERFEIDYGVLNQKVAVRVADGTFRKGAQPAPATPA